MICPHAVSRFVGGDLDLAHDRLPPDALTVAQPGV
jgi:hypothetical protein